MGESDSLNPEKNRAESDFKGDPKNAQDILRYVEQQGKATHITVLSHGPIRFVDEEQHYIAHHMREDSTKYLSLGNPEVTDLIQGKIAKGYKFEPKRLGLFRD